MLKYKAQTDKTKESKAKQINTVCAAKMFHLNGQQLNPLSLSIHIQILQTDLHTFPLRFS